MKISEPNRKPRAIAELWYFGSVGKDRAIECAKQCNIDFNLVEKEYKVLNKKELSMYRQFKGKS